MEQDWRIYTTPQRRINIPRHILDPTPFLFLFMDNDWLEAHKALVDAKMPTKSRSQDTVVRLTSLDVRDINVTVSMHNGGEPQITLYNGRSNIVLTSRSRLKSLIELLNDALEEADTLAQKPFDAS